MALLQLSPITNRMSYYVALTGRGESATSYALPPGADSDAEGKGPYTSIVNHMNSYVSLHLDDKCIIVVCCHVV